MLILLIRQLVFAQEYAVDKGASIISGVVSFESSGGDLYGSNRNTLFVFAPSFSHLVSRNFLIGGIIEYAGQWDGSYNATQIAFGPHLGFAAGNETSTTFPYFVAGFHYITSNSNYGSFFGSTSLSGTEISLGAGAIVAMKKHLGMNVSFNFDFASLGNDGNSRSGNTFSIGLGISGLLFKENSSK